MLKESDVAHHFVVRVRVAFGELGDAVEHQDLTKVLRLMHFDCLVLGALGIDGRLGREI